MAATPTRTLVLLGLRIKGTADADAIAGYYDLDRSEVAAVLDDALARAEVEKRRGRFPGMRLTDEGRVASEAALAAELDDRGVREPVEDAYDQFLDVNGTLLDVCTAWQLRDIDGDRVPNDHRDAAYDAEVIGRLHAAHDTAAPILARLGDQLERFRAHADRLAVALARLDAGDTDYFTKPMIPSYHSVWFELHEDLLATLGRTRESEAIAR